MTISIILAHDDHYGIGLDNKLPWHCPDDLKWFKSVTAGKTVVMGRKTYESLGFKSLPNRRNIVLSSATHLPGSAELIHSLSEIPTGEVFIIGGANVYRQALEQLPVKYIYATRIKGTYETDTHFKYSTQEFRVDFEINKGTHSFLRFSNTLLR